MVQPHQEHAHVQLFRKPLASVTSRKLVGCVQVTPSQTEGLRHNDVVQIDVSNGCTATPHAGGNDQEKKKNKKKKDSGASPSVPVDGVDDDSLHALLPPSDTHWVGLYAHASPNISEMAPAKFVFVSLADPQYLQTGKASFNVSIVNMREDYVAHLFVANWFNYTVQDLDNYPNYWRSDYFLPKPDVDIAEAFSEATHVSVAQSEVMHLADWNEPVGLRGIPLRPSDINATSSLVPGSVSETVHHTMQFLWSAKETAHNTTILKAVFYANPLDIPACANVTAFSNIHGDTIGDWDSAAEEYYQNAFAACPACTDPDQIKAGLCPPNTRVEIRLDGSLGSTSTFSREQLCGEPAATFGWMDPGLTMTALLPQPVTGERFVVLTIHNTAPVTHEGSSDELHTSSYRGVFYFTYPPETTSGQPTSIAAFGDLGRGTRDASFSWNSFGRPSINTTERLSMLAKAGDIDAVLHFGDLAYAVGYQSVWQEYMSQVSAFASRVPYMTSVGNHEFDEETSEWPPLLQATPSLYMKNDSGGECGVPALTFFPAPHQHMGPYTSYWSYDIGNMHLISLNTETDFSWESEQWQWLQADLEQVDRAKTPWVIFSAHRMMYISSWNVADDATHDGDYEVADMLVEHIEPLLVQYNVSLALYGHYHGMQRHCASYRGQCMHRSKEDAAGVAQYSEPEYPVHVVVGSAGARMRGEADWWADEIDLYIEDYTEQVASQRADCCLECLSAVELLLSLCMHRQSGSLAS